MVDQADKNYSYGAICEQFWIRKMVNAWINLVNKRIYISWWNSFLGIIYSYLSEASLFLLHLSMSKLNIIILRSVELPFASISSCPNEVDINIGVCFSTKFSTCVYMDLIHHHYKKKKHEIFLAACTRF